MLEASRVESYPFTPTQSVKPAEWQTFLQQVANMITEEQSPQRLLLVRAKLYELLTNCIPADVVMSTLTEMLLNKADDTLRHQVGPFLTSSSFSSLSSSSPFYYPLNFRYLPPLSAAIVMSPHRFLPLSVFPILILILLSPSLSHVR